MKQISPGLAAHLAGGTTTLAWCWKLTRRDGVTLGFTEHDCNLTFDGVTYEAACGLTASALETSSGLNVDNLDVAGAFSSLRLDEGDLAAGLYDDADIEIWRVNWTNVDERLLMRKGNLGEIARSGAAFTAELRGLAHRLNQLTGRLYQYGCDADFGDARCGLDTDDWTIAGTVMSASGATLIVEGLSDFAAGHFTRGRLTFASGANEGAVMEVKSHAPDGRLELWRAPARPVAPGDTVSILAGCDKQFSTCHIRFANAKNFRGFPYMPGNDFVLARAGN
jgi:uncharacterized phage protein (TIGR02218 family)